MAAPESSSVETRGPDSRALRDIRITALSQVSALSGGQLSFRHRPGSSPEAASLRHSVRHYATIYAGIVQVEIDGLVTLHDSTLAHGRAVIRDLESAGIDWTSPAQTLLLSLLDSQRHQAEIMSARLKGAIHRLADQIIADEIKPLLSLAHDSMEVTVTTQDEIDQAPDFAIEIASQPFVATVPVHGLKLRTEATAEELQTMNATEQQRLAVLAEHFLSGIAELSSGDIARLTQAVGFQAMLNTQQQQAEADEILNTQFAGRFRSFSNGVLDQSLANLRGLQSLADSNIREIVVNIPYFQQLPHEKQSFVQLIVRLFRG